MHGLPRFIALALMLVAGIGGGIGLSAVLTGSSADDPCRGFGTRDRVITGPAEEGSKEFSVCTKPGYEVIFDPEGTPVSQTLREEELIEYYKTHPAENPRVIAEQTADAEFAETAFMDITPPEVKVQPGECPADMTVHTATFVGVEFCLPADWKVMDDSTERLKAGVEGSAAVEIYAESIRDTGGTRCARPALVETNDGTLLICARDYATSPWGEQGHGLLYPNGREGGLSLSDPEDQAVRDIAFQVAYSARFIDP